MKPDEVIQTAQGTPIALCLTCAAAWQQAYTIRQLGLSHTITCEGCRKRRFGALYAVERKAAWTKWAEHYKQRFNRVE